MCYPGISINRQWISKILLFFSIDEESETSFELTWMTWRWNFISIFFYISLVIFIWSMFSLLETWYCLFLVFSWFSRERDNIFHMENVTEIYFLLWLSDITHSKTLERSFSSKKKFEHFEFHKCNLLKTIVPTVIIFQNFL